MYIWRLRLGENLLKLLFGLIKLFGSSRPKFDVWPNRRLLNLGWPKLEFGWFPENFGLWPVGLKVPGKPIKEKRACLKKKHF